MFLPCSEQLDPILRGSYTAGLAQLPWRDRASRVNPPLLDPFCEFGQVERLQVLSKEIEEASLAVDDFVGGLAAVKGAAQGVDEGCAALFLLAVLTAPGGFAFA